MSTEEIAALLTIYFDNMAAMNAKGWLEIFSEDAVIHDPVGNPQGLYTKILSSFSKYCLTFSKRWNCQKTTFSL